MKIPATLRLPFLVLTVFVFAVTFLIVSVPARTSAEDDSAAVYKAKCAMCHGATAEKKFDATKPDAELTDIVLKGKKAEKPPNMPAFAEKGITAEQAATLVGLMKSQKH
ncbi:MAG TPA: cytochrome c [Pyrinomonadaceae bacterium]|nr:cytochrome c [Pyrinomonadaceae bacterium]